MIYACDCPIVIEMRMYILQYREPGKAEWHSIWVDIHSKTASRARDLLDKKRRRAEIPVGSSFRMIGPKGYSYYFTPSNKTGSI